MADTLQAEKDAMDLKVAKSDLTKLNNLKKIAEDAGLSVTATKLTAQADGLVNSDMGKANTAGLAAQLNTFGVVIDGQIAQTQRTIDGLEAKVAAQAEASE